MFCFRARVNDASDYILTINDESDCLRKKIASAITYYLGGGGGGGGEENGPFWQFYPTTEESLKNALPHVTSHVTSHVTE
jgi:hypothetical protein